MRVVELAGQVASNAGTLVEEPSGMGNEKPVNHEARLHGGDVHEPIPGEREQSTAMPLSHPFGEESQAMNLTDTMDEPTRHEHRKEGGGSD